MNAPLLLEGRDITVRYERRTLPALYRVSFTLAAGQSLGIVGESGSGKSTLARAVLRLVALAEGQVLLRGVDLATLSARELREQRRDLQLIFQDPLASLDPRMRIEETVAQPLRIHAPALEHAARRRRVLAQLESVGLSASHLDRYPHEFSGGQAQRIGIARALIADPAVLLCDEPVSALDVSIRAQILAILKDLQRRRDLALLFIAHDLAAVRHLCTRTLVLYRGEVMEEAPTALLFESPRHPYTEALLSAVVVADPVQARARRAARVAAAGLEVPAAATAATIAGCVFRERCPHAVQRCVNEKPELREVGGGRVACHRAEELQLQGIASGAVP